MTSRRKRELQALEQCVDPRWCHLSRRGLPDCRNDCALICSFRNERLWMNIERVAAEGNRAAMDIVEMMSSQANGERNSG